MIVSINKQGGGGGGGEAAIIFSVANVSFSSTCEMVFQGWKYGAPKRQFSWWIRHNLRINMS